MISMEVDGKRIECSERKSVLVAALEAGSYIPHLCWHPQLDSFAGVNSLELVYQGNIAHRGDKDIAFEGCNLCLVEIEGHEGQLQSCKVLAEEGMVVHTDSPELKRVRQDILADILKRHPHACLLCPQSEGCDRKVCSVHVPEEERCCSLFGNCELEKVAHFVGMDAGIAPYVPLDVKPLEDEPLILRDYGLCISCLRCVRICKEVKGADALGFVVEEGRIVVGSREPTLKESGCQFCGYCVEVCPTGALTDRDAGLGERETYLIPCKSSCPAQVDVPEYVRSMKEGKFDDALKVIYDSVPLPETLGRVCFHPCERGCRRGSVDQPVAICALKRAAADQSEKHRLPSPRKRESGKLVAVVGSGPAGLAAAYYLSNFGHSVVVFESLPEAGGMLRIGIPAYRLPRDVLDREIKRIEDVGVEIKTDSPVDSLEELLSNGFDAVFVAVGAHKGRKLGIAGEASDGVVDGVAFLRNINLGQDVAIEEKVAVIGGGNVALDSARSALRRGGRNVTIYYRRTRDEMPAYDEEIEAAMEEGVNIEYQVAPNKIQRVNNALEIELIRMRMGDTDSTKRRRPIPIEKSEFKMKFDTVISAVGQMSQVPDGFGLSMDREMKPNPAKGVFLGGDLLTGPKSVVDAIAGGRNGAILIDEFLGGKGNIGRIIKRDKSSFWSGPDGISMDTGRLAIPMLQPQERLSDFSEVSLGFDRESAIAEAGRCLGCDLRLKIKSAVLPQESRLILSEDSVQCLPEEEGVYILYDEEKEIYQITGVENIRKELLEECEKGGEARYYSYEMDQMFTSRERQLLQQYLKKHGDFPVGNRETDELF